MSNVNSGFEQPQGDKDNAIFIENELVPQLIGVAIAAAGANVSEITLTVQDGHGVAIAKAVPLKIWLSDDAGGLGLTSTSASGTVTAKSASGEVFGTLTAKKALEVQTLANGTFILEITDTAKTGFYVATELPVAGLPSVSRQLLTADYG